jgi:predicted DNA-binding transcriptional regulator YafY
MSLTSRQLERLLDIDNLLRTTSYQTSVSLAGVLEVTERTVLKDLAFLRDRYHAPLEYAKKKGWYYTDGNWRLPSVSLSKGEIFAVTLGAKMLESHAGSAYEKELRSSIQRLSERLPEKILVDLQQLANERIIFRSGAQMVNLDSDIWQQMSEACNTSRRVWIRYYAATRNQESERVIEPYFLDVYRATNPYVIAFCCKRQAFRDFRIDRIRELKVLEETFERDPSFKAKSYLNKRFQNEGGDRFYNVAIWFDVPSAPFIRERQWHPSQIIEERADGSLILRMVVEGLNDLKRWVLGYGKGAIVQEPPELVDLVQAEIEGMYRAYSSKNSR